MIDDTWVLRGNYASYKDISVRIKCSVDMIKKLNTGRHTKLRDFYKIEPYQNISAVDKKYYAYAKKYRFRKKNNINLFKYKEFIVR